MIAVRVAPESSIVRRHLTNNSPVVRPATRGDAADIHALISRYQAPGRLLPRIEEEIARHADRFVVVVDGHFKSEFDTMAAAEASGRKLKSAYPMLQIEIYDAAKMSRTPLS